MPHPTDPAASRAAIRAKKTLLVKHADVVVTMDGARREIRDGGLYVEDNRIVAGGPPPQLTARALINK